MGLFDFFKRKNVEQKNEEENIETQSEQSETSEESEQEYESEEVAQYESILKADEEMDAAMYESEKQNEAVENIQETSETEQEAENEPEVETYTVEPETDVDSEIKEDEIQEYDIKEDEAKEDEAKEQEPSQKKGFFSKLLSGLGKTRKTILGGVDSVLGAFTQIDEDLFEELEEVLIMADIGVETTMNIIDNLRKRVKKEHATEPSQIKLMLEEEITKILVEDADENYSIPKNTVALVIGVNGVGKTTTIGKLGSHIKSSGRSVLFAAADTFRAAASDQLKIWGERASIDVISHKEGSDPAAVVFDAVNAAKGRKTDVLLCDTAGRLHNKKNLMEELKKIARVIDREYPAANKEVFLVLDATTGQNALQQAKLFKEAADITGIILTKLDGTAKGGIVIAIKSELKIPVRFIGVGEGIDDLQEFSPSEFARALFEK